MTESIRKLSNFNFQWTETLYQNNFKHIASFFTLFEGYKWNKLWNNTKEKVVMGARENKLQKPQISQNEILEMTILPYFLNSWKIWNLSSFFGLP